jgi:hypothetical protein
MLDQQGQRLLHSAMVTKMTPSMKSGDYNKETLFSSPFEVFLHRSFGMSMQFKVMKGALP